MLKPTTLFLSCALALTNSIAQAETSSSTSTLETMLTDALRYDATKAERVGNSGKAIQAYMRAGIVIDILPSLTRTERSRSK